MVSTFNRFQFPANIKGSKKKNMCNCPSFNTSLDGIFQHRAFLQTDSITPIKEFFTHGPFMGLSDLFSSKISYNC